MRIVGYLSSAINEDIESMIMSGCNETMKSLQLETSEMFSWIAYSEAPVDMAYVHKDPNKIMLIDGPPIVRTNGFDFLSDENLGDISTIISRIETNSPICMAKKIGTSIQLTLSSSRAGPGKMWYTIEDDILLFSNDIRILIHLIGYKPDIVSLFSIFRFGRVLEPRSISANIHCVSPGFSISVNQIPIRIEESEEFSYSFKPTKTTIADFSDLLEETTDLLSSLNVDLLISGGVDSTLLASMMDVSGKNGFFLMFDESDPELPYAEEAASSTGIPLTTFKMTIEDALESIFECPKAHIQPTVDFSAINTFYLMNQIKKNSQDTIAILDGNGTEFILGPMTQQKLKGWQVVGFIPCPVRKLARKLYSKIDVMTFHPKVTRSLIPVSRAAICRTDVAPYLVFPMDGFLTSHLDKIDIQQIKLLDSVVHSVSNVTDLKSYLTVASIYTSCHVMCAKTHEIGVDPIKSIYPFLWKSFLIEQGQMSWDTKSRESKFKYPLMKILEKYMPKNFVHRKKSGFTPPMEKWILDSQINEQIQQVLDSLSPVTRMVVSQSNLNKAFQKAKNRRTYPPPLLSLIWATLFTEIWLRKYAYHQTY